MIDQYDINLAFAADAAAISELSRDAIEHGLPWSWTPRRVARSIRDRSTNVIVARQPGGLLGFGIMKYEEEEAHLLLLAVHTAQRRKGVGSALLAWLEATVGAAGIGIVRLETRAKNDEARSFYRHHGFEEVGLHEGYYQGVEDAMRMAKDLRHWR
ncbi:MAG TPA: GNAT family N-acetyltransferase [Albitalea sp.]|nr:GNAT family N-acetyltransferase [Albitalea sp.]